MTAYRRKKKTRELALTVVVLAIGLTTAASAETTEIIDRFYFDAHGEDEPVRNFVYLAHRAAAVIWITVEWIAAIILVRAYAFLKTKLNPIEAQE